MKITLSFTSLFLLLLLAQGAGAQAVLSGKFTDSGGHPVEYLSVTAVRGDSILAGTLTDLSGAFKLNLPSGAYTLEAARFGKQVYEKKLVLKRSVDLGTLSIKAGLQLRELGVTAHKKLLEQKVDRLVFNVENSIAASGGDALDALRITPGVQLRGDVLSLVGKGPLRVMVEGRILPLEREALTQFLESVSADDLQRIEVIPNPPAQYEAAGRGGLINLIYKKGRQDHWSAELRGAWGMVTYPYYKAGGHFSYRKHKLDLSLDLNARDQGFGRLDTARTYYPDQIWFETTDDKTTYKAFSGRLALGYALSDRTSLGLQYSGVVPVSVPNRNYDVMRILDPSERLDSLIKTNIVENAPREHHALNLYGSFKPDTTARAYAFNLDYFHYQRAVCGHSDSQSYGPQGQVLRSILVADHDNRQRIENYSAKVDVTQPVSGFTFAYGAQLSLTQSDDQNSLLDARTGEAASLSGGNVHFQYRENTQALYLSTSKELGPRWDTKLGLRLENTQTRGLSSVEVRSHENRYTRWFPSFYLAYKPSAAHRFSLAYGKRIERPSYHMLNPARWYFSGNSYVMGNPFLQPSFTDDLSFSHTWKEKLTSKLHCYRTRNGFAQLPSFNVETGQQIYNRENFYTSYTYSLETYFHFKPCAGWQSRAELHLNYVNYDFYDAQARGIPSLKPARFAYFSTNQTFLFNRAHL